MLQRGEAARAARDPADRRSTDLDRPADRGSVGGSAAGNGAQDPADVCLAASQGARRTRDRDASGGLPGSPRARQPGRAPVRAAPHEARGAEPAVAGDRLREALALWRGPALVDFAFEPWAQTEIAPARGAPPRRVAGSGRGRSRVGRAAELIAELEALVAEYPLRERLRGQLMLALYRSGRQADALAAYRAARVALVERARDRARACATTPRAGDPRPGPGARHSPTSVRPSPHRPTDAEPGGALDLLRGP